MKNLIPVLSLIILVSLILSGCSPKPNDTTSNDTNFKVVATIGMIADVASEIGGERADVIGLMGPGVDPHLYKASAGDVRRLQEAELILYNGVHLEARMGEVLEQMSGQRPVYAVAEGLGDKLIGNESFGGTHDPHVWFDVNLWITVTGEIAAAMIEADPDGASEYEANLAVYMVRLKALQEEVIRELSSVPEKQRVLITAHDAFGYFGKAYGFDVRGLQGISTVSEAGAKDVQALADFITDNRISAIFVESSVPRRSIEALQAAVRDRGFEVNIGGELFSDAMGEAGTEEGTYIGMVMHNVSTIANALGGE